MDGFSIIAGHMKGGKYCKFQSLQQIDAHLFYFIPPILMHVKHTKILFHGIESNAGYISVLIVVTTCFYRAGFIYLYPY